MEKVKELTICEEQAIQLEMLQCFSDVCAKENLPYFLAYGTLLGAVRDKGFIEWDDDVDIWMPRADLKRFCEVFNQYAPDDLFLQTSKSDPTNITPTIARICKKGSYKWPLGCENEEFETGIYMDIFGMDRGRGAVRDKVDLKRSTLYHTMLTGTTGSYAKAQKPGLKDRVFAVCSRGISRKRLIKKCLKLVDSHAECKSDTFLVFAASYAGVSRSFFDASWFDRVCYVPFEHLMLPIPEEYDKLLRYMYGEDYMTPRETKGYRTIAYLVK